MAGKHPAHSLVARFVVSEELPCSDTGSDLAQICPEVVRSTEMLLKSVKSVIGSPASTDLRKRMDGTVYPCPPCQSQPCTSEIINAISGQKYYPVSHPNCITTLAISLLGVSLQANLCVGSETNVKRNSARLLAFVELTIQGAAHRLQREHLKYG
jgi:hypothetical protein